MTTIKISKEQLFALMGLEDTKNEIRISSLAIHLPNDPTSNDYVFTFETDKVIKIEHEG